MCFFKFCIKCFFNNIFTRQYWIHFPLICIPLSLIEFESIQLNLNPIVELKFNQIEFKYIEWISILYRKELVFFILATLNFIFLVPQWYLLFSYFPMFLVLMQIKKIYCMLHIASYHRYSLVEIHSFQSYFNISCHWHMKLKWVFYLWAWIYFSPSLWFAFTIKC
jgi:hypothetical protein